MKLCLRSLYHGLFLYQSLATQHVRQIFVFSPLCCPHILQQVTHCVITCFLHSVLVFDFFRFYFTFSPNYFWEKTYILLRDAEIVVVYFYFRTQNTKVFFHGNVVSIRHSYREICFTTFNNSRPSSVFFTRYFKIYLHKQTTGSQLPR